MGSTSQANTSSVERVLRGDQRGQVQRPRRKRRRRCVSVGFASQANARSADPMESLPHTTYIIKSAFSGDLLFKYEAVGANRVSVGCLRYRLEEAGLGPAHQLKLLHGSAVLDNDG